MQATLEPRYMASARFGGVLRYHYKRLGRSITLLLLVILCAQLLSLAFPLITGHSYPYAGVYADLGTTLIAALVCASIVAGSGTRFLLRFGTSRFSVWLGSVLGLSAAMVALLLGTLAVSALTGGLVLLLTQIAPGSFAVRQMFTDASVPAFFQSTLLDALRTLPAYALYTVEWTCLFYLFGCCLRRNRLLTLGVVIGVPLLMMILLLIPDVRQAAYLAGTANEAELVTLGLKWLRVVIDIADFVQHQWRTLQLLGAAASLPLSYLCMRGTQQP